MIILGIETSCDETACAILTNNDKRITILSNIVASSALLQAKYGGIIPEQAAREQIKSIIPVIEESLQASGHRQQEIDAIAVTYGPGLIGSLLVGVETAKTLALIWNKPLIPVNHLLGHFYANWITPTHLPGVKAHLEGVPSFPCIGLLVSGGHTDLVLFTDHGKYKYLGGTRDDAAGECFDKCARLLGLPYPGGPIISKLAQEGNPKAFKLPRPMINSKDFDFSFSGLKTAVANITDKSKVADLAASIQQAIVDVLVKKSIQAVEKYQVKNLIVAGGVAANQKLVSELAVSCQSSAIRLFVPPPELCTDNGAMIASAAFFQKALKNPLSLQADPNLALVT
ncbi:MAG: tRNA (adenosine(37)-N6)-threonylcarbamoyltransferase complex transferase subunit TsaD [Candidatus Daviesbacteria bacterium]|nr:tRNA (adenosine(37)-N6)-threonylcarbamoyltransferase complex transferase subunit TsaD [Candidatus Daviesbacteria bacterium]